MAPFYSSSSILAPSHTERWSSWKPCVLCDYHFASHSACVCLNRHSVGGKAHAVVCNRGRFAAKTQICTDSVCSCVFIRDLAASLSDTGVDVRKQIKLRGYITALLRIVVLICWLLLYFHYFCQKLAAVFHPLKNKFNNHYCKSLWSGFALSS